MRDLVRSWLIPGLVSMAAVAVLASCSADTRPNVASGKGTRTEGGELVMEEVLVTNNKSLAHRVVLTDTRTRIVGDMLQVEAELAGQKKGDVPFEYRFIWYDDQGFEVNSTGTTWKPAVIGGEGSLLTIRGQAPSPTVTTYRIEIRKPHSVEP